MKVQKTLAITSAVAIGIAVLCFAIGIPIKNGKKFDRREAHNLIMPFNFANDKFEEFQYFVETIQHKWRIKPKYLLNLQEYAAPDNYGHSGYAVKDTDLLVEFFFFYNKLYQSNINTQDSDEAKRWVGYLDSKFGEKNPDGKLYTWDKDDLKIVYAPDPGKYRFIFVDMETFVERQEYREIINSQLARFAKFKQIVETIENKKLGTRHENYPNIKLKDNLDLYKERLYIDNNVENISYLFFQNSLLFIEISALKIEEQEKMLGYLIRKFGKGEKDREDSTTWNVDGITITYRKIVGKYSFTFWNDKTKTLADEYKKKVKS